jgi:hypothetical protein
MRKTIWAVPFICSATVLAIGGANASCPNDMPLELLEDCIVVEGSGSKFPNDTYSNMNLYEEWQAGNLDKLEKPAAGLAANAPSPKQAVD